MPRARRAAVALLVVAVVLAAAWTARGWWLPAVGRLVVEEDAARPVDAVVLLSNEPVLAGAEGATLVARGVALRVLVVAGPPGPADAVVRRLGLDILRGDEVAVRVLRRLGVPAAAIVTLRLADEGTNAEVRALVRWAREHRVGALLVVARRSHTRRVGLLLRRALGPTTTVLVRGVADDRYHPDRWWRERESARELAVEALRWLNSLALGDLWRR